MDLGIAGKRVLVTGASQGIGKGIAEAFAVEGCKVSVIARRKEELEKVIEKMGGAKKGHAFVAADLMEEGAPAKAINELVDGHGDFEIIVNNIGGSIRVYDHLAGTEDWLRGLRLNALIAIEINNIVIPAMVEKGWGRVIHISSPSAEDHLGSPMYATSKAFLNAYVRSVGRKLAETGVVMSALSPGGVYVEGGHWEWRKKETPEAVDEFLKHRQAIGRLGTPEDIAPFALMMASEQAAFCPAAIVPVDGGHM